MAEAELANALGDRLGGSVTSLRRLSGGASRETWAFELDARPLVLRRDPPGRASSGMARESALLQAAAAAGVPVPEVVDEGVGIEVLGSFLVMAAVAGETIPRRILRDEAFDRVRPRLAGQCGEILARIRSIPIDAVPALDEPEQVAQFREVLDGLGEPHPAFELAFRWLESNRPAATGRSVVHGDFRNGNFIVGPDGVRAVLDWELAHVGDPLEDLGWLCVKAWRFGVDLPVGGFGTYDDLIAGYGRPVDRGVLRWWEVLGTLKWGVMCMVQAHTHTSGAVRSVELAAIGRRVCEVEWDLLEMVG